MKFKNNGAALIIILSLIVVMGIAATFYMKKVKVATDIYATDISRINGKYVNKEIYFILDRNINCAASIADIQPDGTTGPHAVKFHYASQLNEGIPVDLWLGNINGERTRKKFSNPLIGSNPDAGGQTTPGDSNSQGYSRIEIDSVKLVSDIEQSSLGTQPGSFIAEFVIKARRIISGGQERDLGEIRIQKEVYYDFSDENSGPLYTFTGCGSTGGSTGGSTVGTTTLNGECLDYGAASFAVDPATDDVTGCVEGSFQDNAAFNTASEWRWRCMGENDGANVDCFANRVINSCNDGDPCNSVADCGGGACISGSLGQNFCRYRMDVENLALDQPLACPEGLTPVQSVTSCIDTMTGCANIGGNFITTFIPGTLLVAPGAINDGIGRYHFIYDIPTDCTSDSCCQTENGAGPFTQFIWWTTPSNHPNPNACDRQRATKTFITHRQNPSMPGTCDCGTPSRYGCGIGGTWKPLKQSCTGAEDPWCTSGDDASPGENFCCLSQPNNSRCVATDVGSWNMIGAHPNCVEDSDGNCHEMRDYQCISGGAPSAAGNCTSLPAEFIFGLGGNWSSNIGPTTGTCTSSPSTCRVGAVGITCPTNPVCISANP